MKLIGMIAGVMLASAGAAHAGEWRYLGGGANSGFVLGVETSGIRRSGSIVTMWAVQVYGPNEPGGVDYSQSFYRFDCEAGSMTTLSKEEFKLDGSPIGIVATGGQPHYPTPDSFAGATLRAACFDEIDRSLDPMNSAREFAEVGRRMLSS